jgi:hypothetical protein
VERSWSGTVDRLAARGSSHAGVVDVVELTAELLARMGRDQQARLRMDREPVDPEDLARLRAVDQENTEWFMTVVDQLGWPDRSTVGEQAAVAASCSCSTQITIRSSDVVVCRCWLRRCVVGQAAHHAYLTDRVLCVEGSRSGTGPNSGSTRTAAESWCRNDRRPRQS